MGTSCRTARLRGRLARGAGPCLAAILLAGACGGRDEPDAAPSPSGSASPSASASGSATIAPIQPPRSTAGLVASPAATGAPVPAAAQRWTDIASWPYEPFGTALTAWTGSEALVFGLAPYKSSGPRVTTGAAAGAYDVAHDRWRSIAPLPFLVEFPPDLVVHDGVAYTLAQHPGADLAQEFWSYSIAEDTWRRLADVPARAYTGGLTVAGDAIVVNGPGRAGEPGVQLYDPAADEWRVAPPRPWSWPYEQDSQTVGLPDGRVVLLVAPPDSHPLPSLAPGESAWVHAEPPSPEFPLPRWHAAVLDPGADSWRPLQDGFAFSVYTGVPWSAVGDLLVLPLRETVSPRLVVGGGDGHDPSVPLGGVLDPATGEWSRFPVVPGKDDGYPSGPEGVSPDRSGDRFAVLGGWAYDAQSDAWVKVPRFPRTPHKVSSAATVWTGDRVLVWVDGRRAGSRHGWSWAPGGKS